MTELFSQSFLSHVDQLFDYLVALLLFLSLILLMINRKTAPKTSLIRAKTDTEPQLNFGQSLKKILLGTQKQIDELLPELEETLLAADVGMTATEKLLTPLKQQSLANKEDMLAVIKEKIIQILTPKDSFSVDTTKKPYVIYLTGVNGSGKTTTIGKLASQFKQDGLRVMLVAADTFRAAAVDQLRVWAKKNDVAFLGGQANADPSSVIVDGLRSAMANNIDIVLVDTAGRLQTKTNLMNELKKMVRMTEKELGRQPDQIFLVVDAITGQNGFSQARIFLEAIPLSGVVLTKYDATAKGGIIISIVEQTGLPIRYVGLGEKVTDLKPFDPHVFVDKLFTA